MNRNDVIRALMSFLRSIFVIYRNEKEFRDDLSIYFQKLGYLVHTEYFIPANSVGNTIQSEMYIDLVLEKNGDFFPIELKYKTNQLSVSQGLTILNKTNPSIQLRKDGANNDNCFLIWKDMQRIEMLASSFSTIPGCIVVLTNDHLYWDGPTDKNVAYAPLSIADNKTMPAYPSQQSFPYKGESLILQNSYQVKWRNTAREDFRFLVLG